MRYYVIMPAHNEAEFLADTLQTLVSQTLLPTALVVVNDNSTDATEQIIDHFCTKYTWIQKHNTTSSTMHMPGSKVVQAFTKGLSCVDNNYDFIVKLDADLLLPTTYFERIAAMFCKDPNVGIAGGYVYEQKNGVWQFTHPMNLDHVRGAFKAYSKSCFSAIQGLYPAMGWDTVDELLARYYGFTIATDAALKVKHLRPTGDGYNPKAKRLQGKAMYAMRYGFIITAIASLKMALKQKKYRFIKDNMLGYWGAFFSKEPFMVTKAQGKFIRSYRVKGILKKLKF